MRILYVAKHGQANSNDDEGAIAHVLRELGHEVRCVDEKMQGPLALNLGLARTHPFDSDLVLFHKWSDWAVLSTIRIPKVFWHFDLVEFPSDPTLARRDTHRRSWMEAVIPYVDLGFCTDGEWVEKMNGRLIAEPMTDPGEAVIIGGHYPTRHLNKLVWLPQGADERVVGFGEMVEPTIDILFTGSIYKCGKGRNSFVREMSNRYGMRFNWFDSGPRGNPVYGRKLANLIAQSKVVVAPDSPIASRYWSNRVYTALGYGAFLLHPYCAELELTMHYQPDHEIKFYWDRQDLFDKIDLYLRDEKREHRLWQATNGLERTRKEHLYRHRVSQLLRVVKERLGVG